MNRAQTNLAEALASRLCHDLAGSVGTVAGLLELAERDAAPAEALALAREAAGQLVRRLRVARAAWGGAAAWPAGGLAAVLADLATEQLRITLDPGAARHAADPEHGRLLLNLALLGAELLRGRGDISFRGEPHGSIAVALASFGPAVEWPSLTGTEATGPRLLQRRWTVVVAETCDGLLHPAGAMLRVVFRA